MTAFHLNGAPILAHTPECTSTWYAQFIVVYLQAFVIMRYLLIWYELLFTTLLCTLYRTIRSDKNGSFKGIFSLCMRPSHIQLDVKGGGEKVCATFN